jgi:hypothetical protein
MKETKSRKEEAKKSRKTLMHSKGESGKKETKGNRKLLRYFS